jgi:hypothetical protein
MLCTTAITLCTLTLSAQAQQLWLGKGQIVEGNNQGALVELKVKVNNNHIVTIQSYPDHGEQVPLNLSTFTKKGEWKIYYCDGNLCAIFKQQNPSRIIYYRLYKQ